MPIDKRTWTRLHYLFDPTRQLTVDESHLYVERPNSVSERLASDILAGLYADTKWIVCGSKGSGKSTELVRLASRLQNERTVVAVNVAESVANINHIQPAEVLFLIGAAAIRTAKEEPGAEISENLVSQLVEAFEGLLTKESHGIELGKILEGVALFAANVASPGVGAVAGAAKGAATTVTGALGERARIPLRHRPKLGGTTLPVREGKAELERLRSALDDILLELHSQRKVVVLVDGLDQLIDSAPIRELFTTSTLAAPYGQVVFGAPIDLMLLAMLKAVPDYLGICNLTNLLVKQPELSWVRVDEVLVEQGRQKMRDVIRLRLESVDLALEDVFDPECVEMFIDTSGGVLRDLIRFVRDAIRSALMSGKPRIDRPIAQEAINEFGKLLSPSLTTKRVKELQQVKKTGNAESDDEHVRDLLRYGFILPYTNSTTWFEPHPVLRGMREGL